MKLRLFWIFIGFFCSSGLGLLERLNVWDYSYWFEGKTHQDWGYMEDEKYVPFDKHRHGAEFLAALTARRAV